MPIELPEGYTSEVRCYPSYDYRDDPKDGRGARSMQLALILHHAPSGGAIKATVSTGWMRYPLVGGFARHDGPQWRRESVGVDGPLNDHYPSGSSVSLHMPTQEKEWWYGPSPCDLIPSGECFGDSGYVIADEVLALLVAGGDEAVWPFLAETMQAWFAPDPAMQP